MNNKTGKFIIDTGASNSCVNLLFSEKFNLIVKKSKQIASSATNEIKNTYYSKNNKLEISELCIHNFKIVLFDMTYINESLKEKGVKEIDGIIGCDILKEYKGLIDFEKKYLSLKF